LSVALSVVLPIYNEAAGIRASLAALLATLDGLGQGYEILCIDDGSTDGTDRILDELARAHPELVVIHFSRNFGKEAALHAGLEHARGQAAVFMDADLQHPPDLLPLMVELWSEGGYEVVEGRKRQRGDEGLLYRGLARIFYRLLGTATRSDMLGSSDYVLLARPAIEALKQLPERNRFFRGLVHWIGFRTTAVEFDVPPRVGGDSRWSGLRLLRYGLDSLLSFTTFPLVVIAVAGLATTLLGSVLGGIALYHYATGVAVSGFTTVILMIFIFSGLILISLGTMSLYLGRLFEEAKGRPLYLVRRASKTLTEASSTSERTEPAA
jgi:dolichol-phosphate mannosyltransferase